MADSNQTFVREGVKFPRRGQNVENEENMEEEVNTTYSLADVALRSAAKRRREEEQKEAKEKEGRKRRSPRSRKPIRC